MALICVPESPPLAAVCSDCQQVKTALHMAAPELAFIESGKQCEAVATIHRFLVTPSTVGAAERAARPGIPLLVFRRGPLPRDMRTTSLLIGLTTIRGTRQKTAAGQPANYKARIDALYFAVTTGHPGLQ
jgi:hypothetical protein